MLPPELYYSLSTNINFRMHMVNFWFDSNEKQNKRNRPIPPYVRFLYLLTGRSTEELNQVLLLRLQGINRPICIILCARPRKGLLSVCHLCKNLYFPHFG